MSYTGPSRKRRKVPKAESVQLSTDMLMEVLTGHRPKQNRSRRFEPILYAFPSYDKCDSLLYFPNAMSRHLNAGDFCKLSQLFSTHLQKDCHVSIVDLQPAARMLGLLFRLFTEVYPDLVMFVHSTKVEGNKIYAAMHSKHTECRSIIDSMRKQTNQEQQPFESSALDMCSEKNITEKIKQYDLPEQEKARITHMVQAGVTLVVYLKVDLTMTFDDRSRKITELNFKTVLTSAKEHQL